MRGRLCEPSPLRGLHGKPTDGSAHADQHDGKHGHGDAYTNRDVDQHAHGYIDKHADHDAHADEHGHANRDADEYGDPDAVADADPDPAAACYLDAHAGLCPAHGYARSGGTRAPRPGHAARQRYAGRQRHF
jgi:hypothetical protein